MIPDVREALVAAIEHFRLEAVLAKQRHEMLSPLNDKTSTQLRIIEEQRRLEQVHLRRAGALEGLVRTDE